MPRTRLHARGIYVLFVVGPAVTVHQHVLRISIIRAGGSVELLVGR